MKKNFLKNKKNGFTLVETLVAIMIFTMSVLAMLSIMSSGITNTTNDKNKIIAGYLAQEGIEYVRNIRDNFALYPANGSWNDFVNTMTPCSDSNLNGNACGFNSATTPTNLISFVKCSVDPLHCKLYLNNGLYNNTSGGVDSGFVRKIWFIPNATNTDEVTIYSDVSWSQGPMNYHVTFSEDLFNWIQ